MIKAFGIKSANVISGKAFLQEEDRCETMHASFKRINKNPYTRQRDLLALLKCKLQKSYQVSVTKLSRFLFSLNAEGKTPGDFGTKLLIFWQLSKGIMKNPVITFESVDIFKKTKNKKNKTLTAFSNKFGFHTVEKQSVEVSRTYKTALFSCREDTD